MTKTEDLRLSLYNKDLSHRRNIITNNITSMLKFNVIAAGLLR